MPKTAQVSLQEVFREVMAGVCSPVSVITAMAGDQPHGTTVSAFASLSLEPPMVMIALDRQSSLLQHVRDRGEFGVNVLTTHQRHLASAFATKKPDKFGGVNWYSDHGLPRLPEAGWLACTVESLAEGGDHIVILGQVVAGEHSEATAPLTYHRRTFGTHATLEPASA